MKRKLLLLLVAAAMLASNLSLKAQMTLQHDYAYGSNIDYIVGNNANNAPLQVVNLLLSGKKYAIQDMANSQVRIYNLNHSLWKTINVPAITGYKAETAYYISENLFKLDNLVDMAVSYIDGTGYVYKQIVINEAGSILNTIDSAYLIHVYNIGLDSFAALTGIGDIAGTGFSNAGHYQVYSLPGKIPCTTCSSGSLGIGAPVDNGVSSSLSDAVPNPSTGQTRIYYTLPDIIVSGTINLISQDGKMINSYKVNSSASYISINTSNLASGTYYYTLQGNGISSITKKLVVTN